MNVKLLYQDKDIVVCVKPAGALSTDAPGGMPELLRQTLGDAEADIRTVHRLDRVTGGLMVFARNGDAARELSRQITEGSFQKEYRAVIHGCPDPLSGRMDDLLFRQQSENKSYVVQRLRKGVKEASLIYETLGQTDALSLVRVQLITGRTHQIRAQFSHRRMPLAGDRKYGAASDECEIALWSCSLHFAHPCSGKKLSFELLPPAVWPWNLFSGACSDILPEEALLAEHKAFLEGRGEE